jgi:hypothetical protein
MHWILESNPIQCPSIHRSTKQWIYKLRCTMLKQTIYVLIKQSWRQKFKYLNWLSVENWNYICKIEMWYMHTWVNSWRISRCLASFCVTEVAGPADAAHLLMESFMSNSFSSKDWISISMDFHDLLDPTGGVPAST